MKHELETCTPTDLTRFVDYEKDRIVSRQLVSDANGAVILMALDASVVIAEHSANAHALIQVLEGEIDVKVDDGPKTLKAGQALLIEPNKKHAVYAVNASKILLTKINA